MIAGLGLLACATIGRAEQINTLASFDGTDGSYPQSTLTLVGSTLYGMTSQGGSSGVGTLFSLPITGGTPTVLVNFDGSTAYPGFGALTQIGSTFYGTTSGGGGHGSLFSVPVTGGTPTVLASLDGNNGHWIYSTPTLSQDGLTFYGTAQSGGSGNVGTLFSVPVTGGTPSVLANFNGSSGSYPQSTVTLSQDGLTLYGTTSWGGTYDDGTVFKYSLTDDTFTVLANFDGANGSSPQGPLVLSQDGSTLYGTTVGGGGGNGTVFSLAVTGGTPTVLASFSGTNGASPESSVILIGSTLYGTTAAGGAYNDGAVFSVPVTGGTITVLANFNGTNGSSPYSPLTQVGSTLYGMTRSGGENGYGTVFSLSVETVPEPSTVVLFGFSGLAMFGFARRQRR